MDTLTLAAPSENLTLEPDLPHNSVASLLTPKPASGTTSATLPAAVSDAITTSAAVTTTTPEADTKLDRPINTRWLLRFALPTMASTMVMSAFGMIDGIFAARVIAPEAFAVTGIVFPFIAFVMAVGFMLSIGGSALVAKKIGQGNHIEARSIFSMLTVVTLIASSALAAFGLLFPNALLSVLGVDELLRPGAVEYLTPMLFVLPTMMVGFFIQQYFITEGKPTFGFIATLCGGLVNIGLNFLLIAYLGWGLHGAALATGIGYTIPALFGVVFFARNRKGTLYFTRFSWDIRALGQSSLNGASEMITMLAISVTSVVMNNILIRLVGYEGVAAASIMFVGQNLLMSLFLGYASGIAPIISFNYGKGDRSRLQRLFKRSTIIILVASLLSIVLGWFLASQLTVIYVPRSTEIYRMAVHAFRIGLIGMAFMGVNTFASVLFTALNNGKISGTLAFFRTLVFVLLMLSLLPLILDLNGVWLALPAAELLALVMTITFIVRRRQQYGYA